MAFTPKNLGFGQLQDSNTALLEPTALTVVHNIMLHNTHTGDMPFTISLKHDSATRVIVKGTIATDDTFFLDLRGEGLPLVDGDEIIGMAETADKINYVICGSEDVT